MVEGVMRRNPGNPWRFVTAGLIALISAATTYVATIRAADATYQLVENWAQLPAGTKWETMTAVDIDSKGTIYVFQRGEPSKIMAFDSKGRLLRSWGDGMFPSAHGLRVDRQDNVWITDRVLHQVMKFSPQGKLLMELGTKGVKGDNDSRDALNGPSDVVIGPNGDIFVSDGESTNTRIVKYSKDGKLIKFWGTKGSGPGQLDVPHSIVMDSKARLYVADRSNKRIEIFDQDGAYIDQMTNAGTPYGLFMTKDDVLYVVDGSQGKDDLTIVNTRDRNVMGHFGGLAGPHMLSVDSSGAIYVAEVRGASIKKFVKR
jgi:DNA-binding beta-propeller fold protein YncE